MDVIIQELFPTEKLIHWSLEEGAGLEAFIIQQIRNAILGLKNGTAPGLRNLPNKINKVAVAANEDVFLQIYNSCLPDNIFSVHWKNRRQKIQA